jgi:hypothetical protein
MTTVCGLGWAAGGGSEKIRWANARAASRSTTVGKTGCPIDDDEPLVSAVRATTALSWCGHAVGAETFVNESPRSRRSIASPR